MTAPQTVLMFSGQGSQFFHMGRELFEREPLFRKWMLDLDAVVRERTGLSVVAAVYDAGRSKSERFDRIELTHPAIFMIEFALAQLLASYDVRPDYTLGASLGAFAAAAVAGCLSAEAALCAVIEQASVVARNCERGGMIAIVGPETLQAEPEIRGADIAAYNFSSHFVVAGTTDRLQAIEDRLRSRQVPFERLAVHYAFHSRWLDKAAPEYCEYLRNVSLAPARVPMACCVTARPVEALSSEYFWSVARQPIRFGDLVRRLETQGRYRYIDAGPSSTLATLLKYLLPTGSQSQAYGILSPYGRDLASLRTLQSLARH